MPPKSLRRTVHQTTSRESEEDRFRDIQADLYLQQVSNGNVTRGRHVARYGGRWNKLNDRYEGDAPMSCPMEIHPGQERAWKAWMEWLRWVKGRRGKQWRKRFYTLVYAGGRRGGKTVLGMYVAVLTAVSIPGRSVWVVVPTEKDFEETKEYLDKILPTSWYSYLGDPHFTYELDNGSKIVMRGAHEPESLKKGKAQLIVMNEAQRMKKRAFDLCRASIIDNSGLVLLCANPPDKAVGQWVGDQVAGALNKTKNTRYVAFDPRSNPHIDQASLDAYAEDVDSRTFEIEILGMFLSVKGAVYHNWDRSVNERRPPRIDNTRSFTRAMLGRPYDRFVSLDPNKFPGMVAIEFKTFHNPKGRGVHDSFMWATRQFLIETGDERDLDAAWRELGWDPERTLVITDASASWQRGERDKKKLRELVTAGRVLPGKGTRDVLHELGWRNVVAPDRKYRANPDLVERSRAVCARIGSHAGKVYLFSDPANEDLNRTMALWENKGWKPDKDSKHAHFGDAIGYAVWHFYPRRRKRVEAGEVRVLSSLPSRADRKYEGM